MSELDDLIRYRLARAYETLDEAKMMAEMEHWNTCVNRLYYACFYAVNALLIKNNLSSPKHSGVKALLNKHFVKPEIVSRDYGRLYNLLFEYRQQSDYEDFYVMEEEVAKTMINDSANFLQVLRNLIEGKN